MHSLCVDQRFLRALGRDVHPHWQSRCAMSLEPHRVPLKRSSRTIGESGQVMKQLMKVNSGPRLSQPPFEPHSTISLTGPLMLSRISSMAARGSLAWDRSAMFKDKRVRKKHAHSGTHSGKRRLNITDGRRVALQNQVCKAWDEAMMQGWEKGGGTCGLAVLFACTLENGTIVEEGWALV